MPQFLQSSYDSSNSLGKAIENLGSNLFPSPANQLSAAQASQTRLKMELGAKANALTVRAAQGDRQAAAELAGVLTEVDPTSANALPAAMYGGVMNLDPNSPEYKTRASQIGYAARGNYQSTPLYSQEDQAAQMARQVSQNEASIRQAKTVADIQAANAMALEREKARIKQEAEDNTPQWMKQGDSWVVTTPKELKLRMGAGGGAGAPSPLGGSVATTQYGAGAAPPPSAPSGTGLSGSPTGVYAPGFRPAPDANTAAQLEASAAEAGIKRQDARTAKFDAIDRNGNIVQVDQNEFDKGGYTRRASEDVRYKTDAEYQQAVAKLKQEREIQDNSLNELKNHHDAETRRQAFEAEQKLKQERVLEDAKMKASKDELDRKYQTEQASMVGVFDTQNGGAETSIPMSDYTNPANKGRYILAPTPDKKAQIKADADTAANKRVEVYDTVEKRTTWVPQSLADNNPRYIPKMSESEAYGTAVSRDVLNKPTTTTAPAPTPPTTVSSEPMPEAVPQPSSVAASLTANATGGESSAGEKLLAKKIAEGEPAKSETTKMIEELRAMAPDDPLRPALLNRINADPNTLARLTFERKRTGDLMDTYVKEATAARSMMGHLDYMDKALKSGVTTGPMTEFFLPVANVLAEAHLIDPNNTAVRETFRGEATAAMIDSAGGSLGTQISNSDVALYQQIKPALGRSTQSNQMAVDILKAQATSKLDNQKHVIEYRKNHPDATVEDVQSDLTAYVESKPPIYADIMVKYAPIINAANPAGVTRAEQNTPKPVGSTGWTVQVGP